MAEIVCDRCGTARPADEFACSHCGTQVGQAGADRQLNAALGATYVSSTPPGQASSVGPPPPPLAPIQLTVDPLIDRVIAGRYKVVRRLGEGGMGAVYAAWQTNVGQHVALKFIHAHLTQDPDVKRRFLNEAKSYARLSHPNAITLHDFGQDSDGSLYICMELFQGGDMRQLLAQRGRLTVVEALDVSLQVADVLGHAHSLGIIHRDLKPENILVRAGLRGLHVKVVDFGIARLLGESVLITQQGQIAGTPGYMAPEQIQGKDVDARTDVYALGIQLFQLVTGKHPFETASNFTEMMFAQISKELPAFSMTSPDLMLPPPLEMIIRRATAKDPADRYPNMEAFASDLAQLRPGGAVPSDGMDKTALPGAPRSALHRKPRRMRWAVLAPVGIAAIAGAFAWLNFHVPAAAVPRLNPADPVPTLPQVPRKSEPDEVTPAPIDAQKLDGMLKRRTALDVLVKSRGEFRTGNLEGSLQLLDGEKTLFAETDADPEVHAQVTALRTEIDDVHDKMARARDLANRGNCKAAIHLYDGLLIKYSGMKSIRIARDQCARMLPPSSSDP